MRESVKSWARSIFHRRACHKGTGMVEFVITLPVWALMIIVMIYFVGLYYRHLATLTTAADCTVIAVHSGDTIARESSRAVRSAYGLRAVVGVAPLQCSASTEGPRAVWGGSQSIHYTFSFPVQPYRSDWIRGLP